MRTIRITGLFRLAPNAAESYARMRADKLPAGGINSAWRSEDGQRRLFLSRYELSSNPKRDVGPFGDVRQYQGKYYKRMRGYPVSVPGTSTHNKGLAIDTSVGKKVHRWLMVNGKEHGWYRPLPVDDPVHFEYNLRKDRARKRNPGWHEVTARVLRGRAGPSESARIVTRKRRRAVLKIEKWVKGDGRVWGVTPEGVYFAKEFLTPRR